MCKFLFALVASSVLAVALGGAYDAQKYYFVAQFSDQNCQVPTAMTMMAIGKCFSQVLGAQLATEDSTAYTTTTYAMATMSQPSTGTQGTLVLQSYSDSSCTIATGSPSTMSLPIASTAAPFGPYGTFSQCASTLPGMTSLGTVYNYGGIYSFTSKLELDAVMGQFSQSVGPMYGTFADPYCSTENTNDPSGNQLPIYGHWQSNGACVYSFLTQKFKKETCTYGNGVSGSNAYSNSWQGFSDAQCSTQLTGSGTSGNYAEVDANYCTTSYDQAFPYYVSPPVGPYTGGFCDAGKVAQYLVLEQYYQDTSCSNGPSAVNAVLLNTCVADVVGYKMATFAPVDMAFTGPGVQGDKAGTLTINGYTDVGCSTLDPTKSGANAYTLLVPTGPFGLPATGCNAGPSPYTQYNFKGGIYSFDDYSKLQAAITNNLGAGTILTTFADQDCTKVNTNTNVIGGGMPIMLTYMSNTAGCVLNIASKASLKTTCAGVADSTTDTSSTANAPYGQLTGSVTLYSDASCTNVQQAQTTYTTGGICYSTAATGQANIVATIGVYSSGFCQLTNEKSYGLASGAIGNNDEADECSETISGVADSPKARAAYVASALTAYPAGTTVTIIGVTATGSTTRRLGADPNDHRELSVAALRLRTIVRNPASTAAALRTAFQNAGSAIQTAMGRRLGASIARTAGAVRTLATRIRNALRINLPGSSPTSSSSCFAANELVTLENGATKAMADVSVGDRILTVNANGEQVFSDVAYLPHGKNMASSTFVTVATVSGRDVKMTANHILPAGACSAQTLPMVSADQVVVGNCVETVSGREQVVSVGKIEGNGIYTVIAMEELIVVNGIVATPYGGVNPTVANIYYNLHRIMYAYAPSMMSKNWVQTATEMLWGDLSTL